MHQGRVTYILAVLLSHLFTTALLDRLYGRSRRAEPRDTEHGWLVSR